MHAKVDRKTKSVVNKWGGSISIPCTSGCGHQQEESLSAIRRTSCVESTQGGLPVWTALRPPSRQEGPRASYIKRQDDEQQAHDNYTHSKSFPLHHIIPSTKQSLLYKWKPKSVLQKRQKLIMCELKCNSNHVRYCRCLFSKDNKK